MVVENGIKEIFIFFEVVWLLNMILIRVFVVVCRDVILELCMELVLFSIRMILILLLDCVILVLDFIVMVFLLIIFRRVVLMVVLVDKLIVFLFKLRFNVFVILSFLFGKLVLNMFCVYFWVFLGFDNLVVLIVRVVVLSVVVRCVWIEIVCE